MTRSEVTIKALTGIKLVEPGDDLGAITVAAFAANGTGAARRRCLGGSAEDRF